MSDSDAFGRNPHDTIKQTIELWISVDDLSSLEHGASLRVDAIT